VAGEAKSEVSPCSSSQRLSIIGIKNSVVAACRTVDSRTSLRMKVVSVVQLKRTEHLPLVGIPHAKERAVLYCTATQIRTRIRETAGTAE
jgi:hypothetical protein